MKNIIVLKNQEYTYKETFDVNLAITYENDRWNTWHIAREFISNALDGVSGDPCRISITEEDGFINICDQGPGYPIVYAIRIGASSKKHELTSIGQFGEGTKMAILTCLRNQIKVRIASRNWLIEPKTKIVEEGLEVLAYDIYEASGAIEGSMVSIEATTEFTRVINHREELFLHFDSIQAIFGNSNTGIYPKTNEAKIYNKGVYIKDIKALFSYALSVDKLNRDRDLIDDDILHSNIRDIWCDVDDPILIKTYFSESNRAAEENVNNDYKEFVCFFYPNSRYSNIWVDTFQWTFGQKAVIHTNEIAAREVASLGYRPVKLDYHGRNTADYLGIKKDIDVCRDDFEYTWAPSLSTKEVNRIMFFHQVASMLGLKMPKEIKVFESYAKSNEVLGAFNPDKDEIYLKRESLNDNLNIALDVFLHEVNHKSTNASDYEREFANGLSSMASNLLLKYVSTVGLPSTLNITNRGFKLPKHFSYSSANLISNIATIGREIVIQTAGYTLRAKVDNALPPYSNSRFVTFHKGSFYINIPAAIRTKLPNQLTFLVCTDLEQI